jgi:hypothetical protein
VTAIYTPNDRAGDVETKSGARTEKGGAYQSGVDFNCTEYVLNHVGVSNVAHTALFDEGRYAS